MTRATMTAVSPSSSSFSSSPPPLSAQGVLLEEGRGGLSKQGRLRMPQGGEDEHAHDDSSLSRLDEPIPETIKRDLKNITRKLLCVVFKNDLFCRQPLFLLGRERSDGEEEEEEQGGGRRRRRGRGAFFSSSFFSQADAADLRQWDLWGPLVLCLFLSVVLYIQAAFSFPPSPSSSGEDFVEAAPHILKRQQRERQRVAFSLVYVFVSLGATVVSLNAKLLGSKLSFFQSVCILGYCLFPLDVAAFLNLFVPRSFPLLKLFFSFLALPWSTGASVSFMAEMVREEKKALAVYPVCLFYVAMAWIICSV